WAPPGRSPRPRVCHGPLRPPPRGNARSVWRALGGAARDSGRSRVIAFRGRRDSAATQATMTLVARVAATAAPPEGPGVGRGGITGSTRIDPVVSVTVAVAGRRKPSLTTTGSTGSTGSTSRGAGATFPGAPLSPRQRRPRNPLPESLPRPALGNPTPYPRPA